MFEIHSGLIFIPVLPEEVLKGASLLRGILASADPINTGDSPGGRLTWGCPQPLQL